MKILKPYKQYAEPEYLSYRSYWGSSGRTYFGMQSLDDGCTYFRFYFDSILNAAGKRTFSFVDGYPNSNKYYPSFEAAKAAGIALAQQAGFIVAETDEEAEKMMLLV